MSGPDTSIPAGFRTTAWSVIRQAQDAQSPQARESLDRLLRLYWRPIYWTIRTDWHADRETARDLTQQFLAAFFEKDLVRRVDPAQGRFRSFVKATLKNFLLAARRDARALKRGGGREVYALDAVEIERLEAEGPPSARTPEELFDRELMRAILEDARAELEKELASEGRREHFEVFMRYYSSGLTQEAVAAETGWAVTDVNNRLYEVRRRYRDKVMQRLRDGVTSDEELAAEARELLDG